MTGQDEPISVESLIHEARQPVETTLKGQLRCLSISELRLYNKFPDVETAYHQMRSKLPNDISDEKIRSACHHIGNSLHHFSQELIKEFIKPKRSPRLASNQIGESEMENTPQDAESHDSDELGVTSPSIQSHSSEVHVLFLWCRKITPLATTWRKHPPTPSHPTSTLKLSRAKTNVKEKRQKVQRRARLYV